MLTPPTVLAGLAERAPLGVVPYAEARVLAEVAPMSTGIFFMDPVFLVSVNLKAPISPPVGASFDLNVGELTLTMRIGALDAA
jgi:hypothetical protein